MQATPIQLHEDEAFLIMTANGWSMGPDRDEALKRLRGVWGAAYLQRHGYVVYRTHKRTEICEVTGNIMTPRGYKPERIEDHRRK